MHIEIGSQQVLRRYLTLFYVITLGLALILAYSAIDSRQAVTPETATITQVNIAPSLSPTGESTPTRVSNTPTSLPAIPSTPDENTPSPLGVTSLQLRGLGVDLWHPWTGAEGAALQTILDEFNRTNRWGIVVQTRAYAGFEALDDAMESALASGTLPDVVADYGYQARHWDNRDALVDLTPYIDDPVWGLTSDEQADFYTAFWDEDLAAQGSSGKPRRLAVPYYRSAYVLFYNQSWARQLGYIKPPLTPEDFRTQACAAAAATPKNEDETSPAKGGWLITLQPGALLGWIYAFGGEIVTLPTEGYAFNTRQTEAAFTYLKELQDGDCAWFDLEADPTDEFANRGALFMVGSLFDIPSQQEAFTRSGSKDEWTVIPFPSTNEPAVDSYGPSLMVTHSTMPEQMAAWLVIEWLVYPPNQAQWVQTLETYPTRMNSLTYLDVGSSISPQWARALDFIPSARREPALASWGVMRWALQDAATQLFDPQFTIDQIPTLLENMDSLASEVVTRVR